MNKIEVRFPDTADTIPRAKLPEESRQLVEKAQQLASDARLADETNNQKEKDIQANNKETQKSVSSTKQKSHDSDSYSESENAVSVGVLLEGNRYSLNGIAPCGGLAINYAFNKKISIGARIGFSYDVSSKDDTIFTVDPLLTIRFSPFSSLENFFLEAQAGVSLANVNGEFNFEDKDGAFNTYIFTGGGAVGYRFFTKKFDSKAVHIEPYIRAGFPFIFGAGISCGISF